MKAPYINLCISAGKCSQRNYLRSRISSVLVATCALFLTSASIASEEKQIIASNESPELSQELLKVLEQQGKGYKPRTEHLRADGSPVYVNRLIKEDSPYLIQHAHNPVNWYPWGEEAFDKAKREDKPIFLSIGYATCHWCHVMERESFENVEIAQILNDNFIAIKVDREQRPDVDSTYMTAVQMLAGRGGWPMSSWLTANAKPFYGGTYYRPSDFARLLLGISDMWKNERSDLLDQADHLAAAVDRSNRISGEVTEVTHREIDNALDTLLSLHDDLQGGFSEAPKFPQESLLFLLLEESRRRGDQSLLDAAHFTLQQMTAGGIHDQIGGGFHRYSVDNEWLVPHFEKMLYNQAALSRIYLLGYQITGDVELARTATRALDYVQREMTSPEGGFYSATDADSEGEEGLFFIWSPDELETILGDEDAQFAIKAWGVTEEGNFEGKNILHLQGSLHELAVEHNLPLNEFAARLDAISDTLLKERSTRIPPLLDDKIISEWNGMMITAFAQAASILNDQSYLDTATNAAQFIWQHNRHAPGALWRAHFNGRSSTLASQTDYAYLAEALLTLYDVTNEQLWLERAIELVDAMDAQFWDSNEGGYFIGVETTGSAALPTRQKDFYDSATPSGNAVAMRVLTHLWLRTGEERFRERATNLMSVFSPYLAQYPASFSYLLTAASELLSGETGSRHYVARGNVKVEARLRKENQVEVEISVKPGWHINADQPLQDYLIGTRLSATHSDDLSKVTYPEAKRAVLGFERSELALFDGNFTIIAELSERNRAEENTMLVPLVLDIQACDDQTCLPPESVTLNVSIADQLSQLR